MEKVAAASLKAGTCPVCGASLRWYHFMGSLGSFLRCRSCQTRLRMSGPGHVALGFACAAAASVAVLLAAGWLRAFGGDTRTAFFVRLYAVAGTAGIAGGMAFMFYLLNGATLKPRVPGEPGIWAYYLSIVGCLVLLLVLVGAATQVALNLSPLAIPSLGGADFPGRTDQHVLGVADPAWPLRTLEGKEVPFGSFQGRVVFLNVWATWCPPCVAEIPSIQVLRDSLKNDEVDVVLVTQELPETVRSFVEKKGWNLPIYIARGVPEVFATEGIPATFVVNRRGEVVFNHIGGMDWNTNECREFLRRLLKE